MTQIENVTVPLKANIYFDGKVVSHSLLFQDGSKKTVWLIYPGSFHFNTQAPENMKIIAGACCVKIDQEKEWRTYKAGQDFDVPENSGFEIEVESEICEYLCSFK